MKSRVGACQISLDKILVFGGQGQALSQPSNFTLLVNPYKRVPEVKIGDLNYFTLPKTGPVAANPVAFDRSVYAVVENGQQGAEFSLLTLQDYKETKV